MKKEEIKKQREERIKDRGRGGRERGKQIKVYRKKIIIITYRCYFNVLIWTVITRQLCSTL